MDDARDDQPREPSKLGIRTIDPLDRHPKGLRLALVVDRHRLEVLDEGRALVPGRVRARSSDVVAPQRRKRDADDVVDANLSSKPPVLRLDLFEDLPGVADEVELVDGEDEVTDTQQRHEVGMPPRLREDAFA